MDLLVGTPERRAGSVKPRASLLIRPRSWQATSQFQRLAVSRPKTGGHQPKPGEVVSGVGAEIAAYGGELAVLLIPPVRPATQHSHGRSFPGVFGISSDWAHRIGGTLFGITTIPIPA